MSETRIRVKKRKRVSRSDESDWGPKDKRRTKRRVKRVFNASLIPGVLGVVFSLVIVSAAVWYIRFGKNRTGSQPAVTAAKPKVTAALEAPPDTDLLELSYLAADKVARAFLAEPDEEKRLKWVRDPDEVRKRMSTYPEEARSAVGSIQDMLDHNGEGVGALTKFSVSFPSGGTRLLDVVSTYQGSKVDWDAYARYGTAGWTELQSGVAKQAMVRVFCEPCPLPVKPFGKEGEWTCYRIVSPELPQWVLGYVRAGSVDEVKMKKAMQMMPDLRERFVLDVVRHELEGESVFEITKCLAVGWVVMGDKEEWVEIQETRRKVSE
jgi:hypothetical protein